MAEMIRGASTKTTHGVDNSKKAGVYMPKKQPEPIITHVEIYARAIRNISDDDVCCKRCISNASNTTYSQLICGRMI